MSSVSKRRRFGFTIVEALAAAALLGFGIVAVYGGMSSLSRAEARARDQDLAQRLADQKYGELISTETDLSAPQSGDFQDDGEPNLVWRMESDATGVENVTAIRVVVEPRQTDSRAPVGEATGLVYVPPATTDTGTTP